jgi:hypothetical protein
MSLLGGKGFVGFNSRDHGPPVRGTLTTAIFQFNILVILHADLHQAHTYIP